MEASETSLLADHAADAPPPARAGLRARVVRHATAPGLDEAEETSALAETPPEEPPPAPLRPRAASDPAGAEGSPKSCLRLRFALPEEASPGDDNPGTGGGLSAEGAAKAKAVLAAFKNRKASAQVDNRSPSSSEGSDNSPSQPNRGKQMWKRVSQNVTRVNDAAALMRSITEDEQAFAFDDSQLTRVTLRLDGMDSYSVLGALISGFSLQLLSGIAQDDFGTWFHSFFAVLFCVSGTLTTMSALYATLIFALNSLHGKAGVGMSKDDGYLTYITRTAPYRESAFLALMTSIAGVVATLLCMLFMRSPLFPACLSAAMAACCFSVAARHVKDVQALASEHIFS